jgi:hypothetical protein
MYKKRGRHDKDTESTNNNEEQFATQFFNFMRKQPDIVISHVSIPQLNLDIGARFTLSNAVSAPDNQKYYVDAIKEPTPCTLLYVKGKMLRTIKVAHAIVMFGRIKHGRPVSLECAVVKVTTIREGHEFEDTDYPYEKKRIEKLKNTKGLWPCKDILLNSCSSSIVSPHNKVDRGIPTSQITMLSTAGCHLSPQHHSSSQNTPPSKNPPPPAQAL